VSDELRKVAERLRGQRRQPRRSQSPQPSPGLATERVELDTPVPSRREARLGPRAIELVVAALVVVVVGPVVLGWFPVFTLALTMPLAIAVAVSLTTRKKLESE
jgi:hypothetical protein